MHEARGQSHTKFVQYVLCVLWEYKLQSTWLTGECLTSIQMEQLMALYFSHVSGCIHISVAPMAGAHTHENWAENQLADASLF